MASNVVVPEMGESIIEATVARWMKQEGDAVKAGEPVVELETDKVNVEIAAEADGVLGKIAHPEGDDVKIGDVLATIEDEGETQNGAQASAAAKEEKEEPAATRAQTAAPPSAADDGDERATPVAKRIAAEAGIDLAQIETTQGRGRITKQDVESFLRERDAAPVREQTGKTTDDRRPTTETTGADPRGEERVRLSRRRRTIAERLVQAQQSAAMLTTFNEIDMSAVMDLRKRRNEQFEKRHGVKVGFMSIFVKACVGALKAFPEVNSELQENELVLKHYYDIGIAVGAEEGLVVPVLRDADRMSFADIEKAIKELATQVRDNTLSIEALRGGTFTITNGGVFGSLLSTPILNPPQVAILGMHKIEERPIALKGEVVIRPMMYVALSYDHRVVDGREAVQFLVRIKELVEDPEALLLEG